MSYPPLCLSSREFDELAFISSRVCYLPSNVHTAVCLYVMCLVVANNLFLLVTCNNKEGKRNEGGLMAHTRSQQDPHIHKIILL